MKVKKFFKKLWNDLKYDELGQMYPWEAPKKTKVTAPTYSTPMIGAWVNPTKIQPKPQQVAPPATQPATPATPVTTPETPELTAALGYNYQPTAMPAYQPQAYNVNLPTIDWSFTPTEAQRGGWQTQATATAAQEIDPQLLKIKLALDQYMTQGQNVRAELNPRYTNQSLAIANIIKNTVKQEAIDSAIRRNATQSGWLPQALMEAGKLETEQRSGIAPGKNL